MVLEALFSAEFLVMRKRLAFLLSVCYSIISISISLYLFPENFIVFSIAFISLLMFPIVSGLLEMEKEIEKHNGSLNLKIFVQDNKDVLQVYIVMFLGITLTFMVFSSIVPEVVMNHLLSNQADMTFSLYSDPKFIDFGNFFMIIGNNIKVLIVCCIAAYFFGAGAVFIITWNASVWGTIFGTILKNASLLPEWNPLLYFVFLAIVILPYLILEASGYLLAGISGGIVSRAIETENIKSKKFENVVKKSLFLFWAALLLIFVAALMESQITPFFVRVIFQ